jgi:peroxiredoxin
MTALGLLLVILAVLSYLMLVFVFQRFTYQTWMFNAVVGVGTAFALIGWILGGSGAVALAAAVLGGLWFLATGYELKLLGSKSLKVRVGDRVPAFTLSTIDGRPFTEQDLIANAPALLELYRGWWCPVSKAQLDELHGEYQKLSDAGLKLFGASVDGPAESAPLQKRVGDKITILCNVSEALLDDVGVRDQRGAPWYDRILYGAAHQDISMPAALVVDGAGKIVFAHRSIHLDDRVRPADILASLK